MTGTMGGGALSKQCSGEEVTHYPAAPWAQRVLYMTCTLTLDAFMVCRVLSVSRRLITHINTHAVPPPARVPLPRPHRVRGHRLSEEK